MLIWIKIFNKLDGVDGLKKELPLKESFKKQYEMSTKPLLGCVF